jgi:hypothetical protein
MMRNSIYCGQFEPLLFIRLKYQVRNSLHCLLHAVVLISKQQARERELLTDLLGL